MKSTSVTACIELIGDQARSTDRTQPTKERRRKTETEQKRAFRANDTMRGRPDKPQDVGEETETENRERK